MYHCLNVIIKRRADSGAMIVRQISAKYGADFLANHHIFARMRLRVTGDMPKKEATEPSEAL